MIKRILEALDELTIAKEVGLCHDEARMSFSHSRNTVGSFPEFAHVIGQYYNHHFSKCISHGGHLSRSEAEQRAREALESHYRRQNGDIVMAFNDAHDGTNGGLRIVLDAIADSLREEAVTRYVQGVFDQYVLPNSWPDKVEIIRQFIAEAQHVLGSSIDPHTPERYARDYQPLIHAYAQGVEPVKRNARRF